MSRFKLPSGQIVQIDTPFSIEQTITVPATTESREVKGKTVEVKVPKSEYKDAVQYPSGIRGLSASDIKKLGIVELIDDPRPDERYGFVTEKNGKPGEWDYTPFSDEMLKERLIDYAKNKRWQKEQGGFDFNGIPISTDDRSQNKIMGARIAANADASFTTPWAIGSEVFAFDAVQIIAVSDAALAHVKNVFVIFAAVLADINSGKIKKFEEIDQKFEK